MTCDRLKDDALVICGEANCRSFLLEFDPGGSMSQSLANLEREREREGSETQWGGREKQHRGEHSQREMNEYTWRETETNIERRDEQTHSHREINENTRGRERERAPFSWGDFYRNRRERRLPDSTPKTKSGLHGIFSENSGERRSTDCGVPLPEHQRAFRAGNGGDTQGDPSQ